MRGESSREGKQRGERAKVVGAGRLGSGPRGNSEEGSVSAWCEVWAAERTSKVGRGPGQEAQGGWAQDREGISRRAL